MKNAITAAIQSHFCGQQPPIQTYQQSQYECAEEEHCRVLVFEPKPEQHAAPQQKLWLSAVHCEQHEINAARPKQWLDWVHGKTSRVAKDHRSRLPEAIVLDNGPEFRSRALAGWSEERGVRLEFIQPGKPVQNAYVESFNGRLRDECLNANWFTSLSDSRRKIEAWRQDYNQQRPHSSLDYVPPAEFARTRAEMRA